MKIKTADYYLARACQVQDMMDDLRPSMENLAAHVKLGVVYAKLGDPANTRAGDWVVAIGSPFGFENSVSAGIVSAKGRSLPGDAYVPFIQTDVAVNPGNSGGPLFNLRGEVVGINSQIYSRSGGYQGLSFAIPIDVAMNVSKQLQAQGHVTRGKLGVGIQDVDQALAESFGLDVPRGALVSSVEKGGPAEKAGLHEGDVILGFDGQAIDSAGQLPSAVAATPYVVPTGAFAGAVVSQVMDCGVPARTGNGRMPASRMALVWPAGIRSVTALLQTSL